MYKSWRKWTIVLTNGFEFEEKYICYKFHEKFSAIKYLLKLSWNVSYEDKLDERLKDGNILKGLRLYDHGNNNGFKGSKILVGRLLLSGYVVKISAQISMQI